MYRPQYAYKPSPAPCQDQKVQYSFDSTNTPSLTGTLAAGARTGRIPLKLDVDADFYLRGIMCALSPSFRLEDSGAGNPLSDSDNAQASTNYESPTEYSDTLGAGLVVLESGGPAEGGGGVFAPGGGNFSVFLYNATAASINLTYFAINLHGVKVYSGKCP